MKITLKGLVSMEISDSLPFQKKSPLVLPTSLFLCEKSETPAFSKIYRTHPLSSTVIKVRGYNYVLPF